MILKKKNSCENHTLSFYSSVWVQIHNHMRFLQETVYRVTQLLMLLVISVTMSLKRRKTQSCFFIIIILKNVKALTDRDEQMYVVRYSVAVFYLHLPL